MADEPFTFGPRHVRIGQRSYPTAFQEDNPSGYQRAVIPMENGNLVHIDHAPSGHGMRAYGDNPFSATTLDDHFFMDTHEALHARLEELATRKLHPDDIKQNQDALKQSVKNPPTPEMDIDWGE